MGLVYVSFDTCPGSATRPNEDFVAAGPNVAVVLDGLTAPPELGTGCAHGTPWFVARLGMELVSAATTACDEPLEEIVCYQAGGGRSCTHLRPGAPRDSVVVSGDPARARPADGLPCVVRLGYRAGWSVWPEGRTDHRVDAIAQAEYLATREHPIGSAAHQDRVRRLISAQRRHRNRRDGYWVAAAKPTAANHAVSGSLPRDRVSRAALLSDGASCLVEQYGIADWAQLMTMLQQHGPRHVISRVREAEAGDPTGIRWPRYKRSDDATAVLCLLG